MSTSYNKRYIRSGSYRSDHKDGRYMKKYVRGLLLFVACVSLLGGCSRSGKGKEEFAENTLYVAEDGSVSWTSVETYSQGDYKTEELEEFAGARISAFNQSLGKASAYKSDHEGEPLPVFLESVQMEEGKAVLVTGYDVPSRLVEFSADIGDSTMPFVSIETGRAAVVADLEQTSYIDGKGQEADKKTLSDTVLKGTDLAVKTSGQGVIATEKKIQYVSQGCELLGERMVRTASEGTSYIILE